MLPWAVSETKLVPWLLCEGIPLKDSLLSVPPQLCFAIKTKRFSNEGKACESGYRFDFLSKVKHSYSTRYLGI